jgi:TonB family protein
MKNKHRAKLTYSVILTVFGAILLAFGCVRKEPALFDGVFTDSTWSEIEKIWYDKAKTAATPDSMAECLSKLKALRPKSKYLAEIYYDLGERYKQTGQYDKAIEPYRQATTFPDTLYQAGAQLALAECYYKLSDWQNAAKEYEEFIRRFPKHKSVPGALYYGSASYFNIGKNLLYENNPAWRNYIQKALDLFDKALRNFPKSEFREKYEILRKEAAFAFDQPEFTKSFASEPGYRGPAFCRRILKDTLPYFKTDAGSGIKEAKFVLHFDVTPQGAVHNVVVKKGSGVSEWDQSFQQALSEWLFAPLPAEAEQADQWGEITIKVYFYH